jgi:hypothetical protein
MVERVRGLPAADVRMDFTVPRVQQRTPRAAPIRVRMGVFVLSSPLQQTPFIVATVLRVMRGKCVNIQKLRAIPIRVRMGRRVLWTIFLGITSARALRVTAERNVKRQSQRVSPIRVKVGAFVFVVVERVRVVVRLVGGRVLMGVNALSVISLGHRLTVATTTALLL